MSDTKIEVVEMEFGQALEIESKCKMMKMPVEMGQSFTKINNYMKENEVGCTIAPYARYEDVDWEYQITAGFFQNFRDVFKKIWHFHSGITIKSDLEPKESMKFNNYKMAKYVKAVHFGPYQNVGKLYSEMYRWAKTQGLKCAPESIEFYVNDPGEVKKKDLETILYIPVQE